MPGSRSVVGYHRDAGSAPVKVPPRRLSQAGNILPPPDIELPTTIEAGRAILRRAIRPGVGTPARGRQLGGWMADCETDSGVETTVTAVSGAGFETESEAKDAKLEALRPQIEQDRHNPIVHDAGCARLSGCRLRPRCIRTLIGVRSCAKKPLGNLANVLNGGSARPGPQEIRDGFSTSQPAVVAVTSGIFVARR